MLFTDFQKEIYQNNLLDIAGQSLVKNCLNSKKPKVMTCGSEAKMEKEEN